MASGHRFTGTHKESVPGSARKVAEDLERLKQGRKRSLPKADRPLNSMHFSYDRHGRRETKACESRKRKRGVNLPGELMCRFECQLYMLLTLSHTVFI